MATKKHKRDTTSTKPKKAKKTADVEEIKLDPEVEAFANWFADWWLRRGHRLYKAAKEADPAFAEKRKRSKRDGDRLPFHWDEETERFVLDRDPDAEG